MTTASYNNSVGLYQHKSSSSTMNIMLKVCAWMLLMSSFCFVFQASAFQIKPSQSRQLTTTATGVAEKKPRWTELPRARDNRPELFGFEINTGRIAMIGFCGLLAEEIISGRSFGEQFVQAISSAAGTNLPIV